MIASGATVQRVSILDSRLFVPKRQTVQEAQVPASRITDTHVPRPQVLPATGTSYLPEEDDLILQARELNKSWAEIASMLPGRSSTAIRKHYTNTLRPKVCASASFAVPATHSPLHSRRSSASHFLRSC